MDYEITDTWSTNGKSSLKLTGLRTGYCAINLCRLTQVQTNEEYVATVDVLNNSTNNVYLRLIENDNNKYSDVSIPNAGTSQKIIISRVVSANSSDFRLVLIIRNEVSCYVDNITLSKR